MSEFRCTKSSSGGGHSYAARTNSGGGGGGACVNMGGMNMAGMAMSGASMPPMNMPGMTTGAAPAQPQFATTPAPASAPAGASYTCPMHPSVLSAVPGACPVCHMAL